MDRRIGKSRAALRAGLLTQLRDLPLTQVTVQTVSEAADVARKTFYQHYQNLDALLADAIDMVMAEFFDGLRDEDLRLPLTEGGGAAAHIVGTWMQQRDMVAAVLRNGVSTVLLERLEYHARVMLDRVRAVNDLPRPNEVELGYVAAYMAGSTIGVLAHWVQHAQADDLAFLLAHADRAVMPVIERLFTAPTAKE